MFPRQAVNVLDLPRYRTIGQLHDGKPRTFCVSNCIHAAHHINQSFESFRFKETRCDRTAISAPAHDGHRRISGKSADASKQLRQRNMDRTLQMIVTPFLGRSHIYNERAPRASMEARKSRAPICVIWSVSSRSSAEINPTTWSNPMRANSS